MRKFPTTLAIVTMLSLIVASGFTIASAGNSEEEGGEPNGATTAAIASSFPEESDFVALTEPCRIVDTRAAGGRIANTFRHFQVRGGNLSTQGGSSSGCGIPAWANAVEITVTAVDPLNTGFIRSKAFDGNGTIGANTILNYNNTLNPTNTFTQSICVSGCAADLAFTLRGFNGSTHVVVDIGGYTAQPFYAVVDGDATTDAAFRKENRFESVTRPDVGRYLLTVDPGIDIRGCAIAVTAGSSDTADALASDDVIAVVDFLPGDRIIEVELNRSDNTAIDEEFTVVVNC